MSIMTTSSHLTRTSLKSRMVPSIVQKRTSKSKELYHPVPVTQPSAEGISLSSTLTYGASNVSQNIHSMASCPDKSPPTHRARLCLSPGDRQVWSGKGLSGNGLCFPWETSRDPRKQKALRVGGPSQCSQKGNPGAPVLGWPCYRLEFR
jgi:hypothetical protein